MKATYGITNVNEVETTLHITMTINEWRKLGALLSSSSYSPGWEFQQRIEKMLVKAHKQYSTLDKDDE